MALFQDVLEAFFPAKKGDKPQPKKEPILTSIAPEEAQQDDTNNVEETIEITPVMRNRKMTREQHVKMLYGRDPSFISNLPYAEYLEEEGVMLFDDAKSAGAVFDIKPIGTEGRSSDYLNRVRTLGKNALADF